MEQQANSVQGDLAAGGEKAARVDASKFWMVVRHDGNRVPTKRHSTREEAEAEAARLTEKERSIFFVLEAVSQHYGQFKHARAVLVS